MTNATYTYELLTLRNWTVPQLRTRLVHVLESALFPLPNDPQGAPPMRADPTTTAQEFFDRLAKSWNDADGTAFGEPFAPEADFVDIRGTHHQGDAAAMGAGPSIHF